jgi:hypothetical protein
MIFARRIKMLILLSVSLLLYLDCRRTSRMTMSTASTLLMLMTNM